MLVFTCLVADVNWRRVDDFWYGNFRRNWDYCTMFWKNNMYTELQYQYGCVYKSISLVNGFCLYAYYHLAGLYKVKFQLSIVMWTESNAIFTGIIFRFWNCYTLTFFFFFPLTEYGSNHRLQENKLVSIIAELSSLWMYTTYLHWNNCCNAGGHTTYLTEILNLLRVSTLICGCLVRTISNSSWNSIYTFKLLREFDPNFTCIVF